jgi:hypothetical protein
MEPSGLSPFSKTQGNREKLINELKSLDQKNEMNNVDESTSESLLYTLNKATSHNNITANASLLTTQEYICKEFT